jgi:hypothetical protein
MAKFCVRVRESGIVHLEINANSASAAYKKVDEMIVKGKVFFPDSSYEYDIDVSGVGEYETHRDIGL